MKPYMEENVRPLFVGVKLVKENLLVLNCATNGDKVKIIRDFWIDTSRTLILIGVTLNVKLKA